MAHYLTFDDSVTCTVNGTPVSSGYELHDGDVILASTKVQQPTFFINDDRTYSSSNRYSNGDTADIYDNDIQVFAMSIGALSD